MSKASHAPTTSVSRRSFIAAGAAATATAGIPTAAIAADNTASHELVALVGHLNQAIADTNAHEDLQTAANNSGDSDLEIELETIGDPLYEARNRLEDMIERFPLRSPADLVILAKLAEHQLNYGQMSDDLPELIVDRILRLFAGRERIALDACASLPIEL